MTKCHIYLIILTVIFHTASCTHHNENKKSLAYYGFQERIKQQESYYFDPNSPYRDEEAYISVLQEIIESPHADSAQKAKALWQLPLISINRPGQKAADFEFTLRNGRKQTLHSLEVKTDYILLFFSNPGCQNCKEIMEAVKEMTDFTVVNIYPDDDIDTWFGYVAEYPSSWISGFAPEIDEYEEGSTPLYYIRAIPSLYLLDRNKTVILKDAPLERILGSI